MSASLIRTEQRMDPILTRAAFPYDFPKAPLIPACSLSAPAHDNILLILRTCQGWTRHLRWKLSFPTCLVKYLLQAIREASRASEDICSTSSETMWTTKGSSAAGAFFLPMSQILILGSGTPRLYLDLGQGFPLQTLQHLAGLLPIQNMIKIIILKNNIKSLFYAPILTPPENLTRLPKHHCTPCLHLPNRLPHYNNYKIKRTPP